MSSGELNTEDLECLVGRELDDRYLLDRFIDRGGFGVVYRGIDKKFNQPVAIKIGLSYREFMKEAKLAAEVRHDNIVQVSDYGHDKGLAYLVMEFLQGDDLEKLFTSQNNQLTTQQLRKLVAEVGDALAHAHAEQLIHRDLKPRNIILKETRTKNGTSAASRFVLLDFGIAAKLDAQGTQRNRTQDGAGTIEYMAPELLKASPLVTQQSDIYAFGVILYQMMMGRVPFPQNDTSHAALGECVGAILHLPAPTFDMLAPERQYPQAAEELVLQCLEKDPADRPRSMAEVRDRFLRVLPAVDSEGVDYSSSIRPEGLSDTNPGYNRNTVGASAHATATAPIRPARSRFPRWLLIALGVIALAAPAATFYLARTRLFPQPRLTIVQDGELVHAEAGRTIPILAGDGIEVEFAVDNLPHGGIPEFQEPIVPAGVRVEMRKADEQDAVRWYSISVPDLNAPGGALAPLTFRAQLASVADPFERSLQLEVQRPNPWLPEELKSLGFAPAADARLCRIGAVIYSSVIERRVGNLSVRLRLVPTTEIGNRRIRTFYVMEQLVPNALFREFTRENPNFEWEPRETEERPWDGPDDQPVTDLCVVEAQRFAHWLGGKLGSLPTATEWELSAGYYDFQRLLEATHQMDADDIPSEKLKTVDLLADVQPVLGTEIWVGPGPALSEYREPGGATVRGCSPYGCRYDRLPSNVIATEMTCTLVDHTLSETDLRDISRKGLPAADDAGLAAKAYQARLRGPGDADSTTENLWLRPDGEGFRFALPIDLNDAGSLSLLPESISRDQYIGFRVVLLASPQEK